MGMGMSGIPSTVISDGRGHLFRLAPAVQQTEVGLQATGIRKPELTDDLAKQAEDSVELSEAAQGRVTTVQPPEPPLPDQDALSASKVLPPEGEHLDKSV